MARMHITPCTGAWEPLDAALRLARRPGLAWLDGGLSHGQEGRYSFVGADPCELRTAPAGQARPLDLLDTLAPPAAASGDAPLRASDVPHWVGYVSYDAAWAAVPSRRLATPALPLARFARHDAWFVYDHEQGRAFLLGDDEPACLRLASALEAAPLTAEELVFAASEPRATDAQLHEQAIRAALAHIREGDVYQINLARCFRAHFSGSALGLFLRMREASPVPLGLFVAAGDHALLGRSMERFLRYEQPSRALWTSPIKGTIARTGDDRAEAERLLRDPKEHAEHAMVVDLMRNDLSRVCEVGSVEVSELMAVLPFRDLAHLISTVRGQVRAGLTLGELLRETFPPGSVTGTPKRRAVELIEALESAARGIYTGAYGFIDRAGGCSLSVAIRTAVVHECEVTYFAGGGIVADSDPTRETAETELKARVFLRALGR
jgi:anthranilate/para-aminobenzoate synthase component I